MKFTDISTSLARTCEKLMTLLDNAAFDAHMRDDMNACTEIEEDRDRLEIAISRNDRDTMQEIIAKHHEIVNAL